MAKYVIDCLIAVTGGFVVLVVCKVWTSIRRGRDERSFEKFWRFKHKSVYIIRPSYHSPSGEDIGENMARVEDILAIDKLTEMLKRRNMHYKVVDHSATIPDDVDIVLVCSPKGNRKSAEAARSLELPYSFEMECPTKPYFLDNETKTRYPSPMDTNNDKIDIALIGRYTKNDTGQVIFLLWGIHGVGTLGAAKCSVDQVQLEHLCREVGDKDFAVLVECQFSTIRDVQACSLLTQPRASNG